MKENTLELDKTILKILAIVLAKNTGACSWDLWHKTFSAFRINNCLLFVETIIRILI
jgi:hypothetical protein